MAVDDVITSTREPFDIPAPGVLDNDTDADGDTLTVTINTQPGHGVVVLNPDGSFTYTPDPSFFGSDAFTYKVSDGNGGTSIGTVSLLVAQINNNPSFPVIDGDLITGDSTNDTFVRNLYEDVLDRVADAGGLAVGLASQTGGGAPDTVEEVAKGFLTSTEYLTNLVNAMYWCGSELPIGRRWPGLLRQCLSGTAPVNAQATTDNTPDRLTPGEQRRNKRRVRAGHVSDGARPYRRRPWRRVLGRPSADLRSRERSYIFKKTNS